MDCSVSLYLRWCFAIYSVVKISCRNFVIYKFYKKVTYTRTCQQNFPNVKIELEISSVCTFLVSSWNFLLQNVCLKLVAMECYQFHNWWLGRVDSYLRKIILRLFGSLHKFVWRPSEVRVFNLPVDFPSVTSEVPSLTLIDWLVDFGERTIDWLPVFVHWSQKMVKIITG